MSIRVEVDSISAEGKAVAVGGTPDQRHLEGVQVTPGNLTTALGRIVLDADNETLKFVPDDSDELDAVIAADEAA